MANLQGTDVLFRRWDAEPSPASPKAVFLLVHGLGAHSARWEFWGDYFAARGYASFAIELRGFGRTPERPLGHVASWRIWDRDILALRDIAGRDFPGRKVFVVGESMGGLIVYDLVGRNPGRFDGTVLMAPAFKNGMKFSPGAYAKIGLMPFRPKAMIALPFTSEMTTRDPDYAAVMNANPDELRVASVKLMAGFLPVQARAARLARLIKGPVLFLVPGIDHLVDERAGRKIYEKVAAADKSLIEYPEMYHALYIDRDREKVFGDILKWTAKRV
jgi:alpha-beta hydrolase superfamily lysophospholipase